MRSDWQASQAPSVLPAYYRLQQSLIANIEQGVWAPGEQIPSERELAQTCNMSVGTVRKALDNIVHAGYVHRIQGKGSFVSSKILDKNAIKFYPMRQQLGDDNALLGVRCLSVRMEAGNDVLCASFPNEISNRFLCIERVFFTKDTQITTSLIHSLSYIPFSISAPLQHIPLQKIESLSLYRIIAEHCGVSVQQCEEMIRIAHASSETAKQLEVAVDSPLMCSEMLCKTQNNTPVELRHAFIRVDRYGLVRTHTLGTPSVWA